MLDIGLVLCLLKNIKNVHSKRKQETFSKSVFQEKLRKKSGITVEIFLPQKTFVERQVISESLATKF